MNRSFGSIKFRSPGVKRLSRSNTKSRVSRKSVSQYKSLFKGLKNPSKTKQFKRMPSIVRNKPKPDYHMKERIPSQNKIYNLVNFNSGQKFNNISDN
jgi:hypothetical protein